MLHVVDFRTPAGDTGEPDDSSIQPYANGESADQTVFRRPPENNRARVETMRQLLREHILLKDYHDGGVAVVGGGTITASVATGMLFTTGASLHLLPFNTPGGGATYPKVASTKSTVSAGSGVNELVFTSVQKQFEGATFPEADANKISVEILDAGASAPLTVLVEGATGEANNIKITLDASAHTLNDVIAAVAAHGTAPNFVVASLGTSAVGTNLCPTFGPTEWGTDLSARFLRGGAPGIVHEVTTGGLATFFANVNNQLLEGDTLAIEYDKVINTTSTGGRVQSTHENTNIDVSAALFNSRLTPAKIPNSIPICKRLDATQLIFANGAVISTTAPATLWFDSPALAGSEGGTLATLSWDRMGTGPDHNPPTTIRQALDNADGHIDAILDEVEAARNSVTYGAAGSLDARIEAHETALLPSARYGAFATADARLESLEGLQTVVVSDGTTSTGGEYNGASALKDAVIALEAASGGTILVRPGTYTWDVNQAVTKALRIMTEGGVAVTVTCTAGVTTHALTLSGATDISNLTFDGTSATGGAISVSSDNAQLSRITCNSFNNAQEIVEVTGDRAHVKQLKIVSTTHTGNGLRVTGNYGVFTSLDLQTRTSAGTGQTLFVNGTCNKLSGVRVVGDQCIFDSTGGTGTVWEAVQITTHQAAASPNSNPVFEFGSNQGSLASCVFIVSGTGIHRMLLRVQNLSTAQVVDIDCSAEVVQASIPVLRIINATVRDVSITNFTLPDATANGSTLNLSTPVIDVHTNGVLEHFRVSAVAIQAGSDDIECVIFGSSTSNTRGATFRGGEVILTGAVTSRGGSRILFGTLSTNTLIDDVDLDATGGEWATAVHADADGLTVQNFRALLDDVWHNGSFDAALYSGDINGNFMYVAPLKSFIQVIGCRISGTIAPSLSGSPIAAFGSAGNAISYLTLTDNIIRTGTNVTSIVLDYVTGATIHGNVVSNGISTTGNTTFVPATISNNNILV